MTARRLAWSLWGLSVLLLAAEAAFAVLNRGTDVGDSFGAAFDTLFRLIILVFATIGALVAARRPRNPIGWIMAGAAVPLAFSGVAHGYAVYALFAEPGSLPGADVMAWLASWIFLPSLFVLPPLLFLLFPTGRILGPRWRPVGWLIALGTLAILPAWTLAPGPLGEEPFEEVVNPVGIEGAGALLDAVGGLGWFALAAGIVASAASMVVRLRRSRGVERQQLKWVASAAALFAAVCLGDGRDPPGGVRRGRSDRGAARLLGDPARGRLRHPAPPPLRHRPGHQPGAGLRRADGRLLAGAYVGLVLLLGLALSPLTERLGPGDRPLDAGGGGAVPAASRARPGPGRPALLPAPLRRRAHARALRRPPGRSRPTSTPCEPTSPASCARPCSRLTCRCGCGAPGDDGAPPGLDARGP